MDSHIEDATIVTCVILVVVVAATIVVNLVAMPAIAPLLTALGR